MARSCPAGAFMMISPSAHPAHQRADHVDALARRARRGDVPVTCRARFSVPAAMWPARYQDST